MKPKIWSVTIQKFKIWGFEIGLEWQKPQNLKIWGWVEDDFSCKILWQKYPYDLKKNGDKKFGFVSFN